MSTFLIHNTLTKLWSNILINGRGKWCQSWNWNKHCAQKAGTHEIKSFTKAGVCTIIAHTVLCCTVIYPIILNF